MDSPFDERREVDKFQNGVLTTTGMFERLSNRANEDDLRFYALRNETRLVNEPLGENESQEFKHMLEQVFDLQFPDEMEAWQCFNYIRREYNLPKLSANIIKYLAK